MATTLQFRRGDTATANGTVGNEGELFVDTQSDTVVVLDGVNAGGSRLATEDFVLGITGGPNVDADTLDGQDGTYYLDYNNLTNTPNLYVSADFDTDLASKTTDDLTEGSTNLYYADSLVDAHLVGSTGVTYTSGSISIGQAVDTTDDVTFNTVSLSAEPTQSSHATTKQYVDEIAQGLSTLPSADYATTGNLAGTYSAGTLTAASNGALQVDGSTVSVGDNILVKDQNNANENGSYNVVQVGDASNPWVIQRSEFADESAEIPGSFEFVTGGNTNANTGWVFTVSDPDTFGLGVDPITVTQFSGAGTFLAGSGLDLNGSTFSHSDTSSQGSVTNSGGVVIQSVDLDSFGHVTGLTSSSVSAANDAQITISAGNGMSGGGNFTTNQATTETITITHADTSSQGSINNSGNTFIQDVTVDEFGHITNLGTATVNIPATANDATITLSAGNGLTGGGNFTTDQATNETITFALASGSVGASELQVSGNGTTSQFLRSDGDGTFSWATPADTQPNNSTISLSAGNGLTGGGSFTVDQSFNETISFAVGSNSIGSDELNVSGTGSNGQVLQSDGDGSFSWTSNIDANSLDGLDSGSFLRSNAADDKNLGYTRYRDNIELYFGSSSDVKMVFNGSAFYTDIINNDDWFIQDSGFSRFKFDISNGDFHADGDVIAFSNTVSDERLKEDITPVTGAVDKIKQIDGVTFTRKHNGKKSAGVIAQQLEKVLPEAVQEKALPLITGSEDDLYKTVEYDALHAVLIEAVKELSDRLDRLENK